MIVYAHWKTALEHYYSYRKDAEYGKTARKQLRRAIRDSYFRTCLPMMIKKGTKDMKLEGICLGIHSYGLYKLGMAIISKKNTRK